MCRQLREQANGYFEQAHRVARHLMQGFALGLDLPENIFLQSCSVPLSALRLCITRRSQASMGEQQFGVAAHTDFGVLTVLCQDENGGLQVQDASGDWIHAPPIKDTLVVMSAICCRAGRWLLQVNSPSSGQ